MFANAGHFWCAQFVYVYYMYVYVSGVGYARHMMVAVINDVYWL